MSPHALGLRGPADPALLERLAALRTELELPPAFPAPVLAEAEAAAREVHAGLTGSPDHADRTALPFVTVDPAGSTDLDQALLLTPADDDGILVRYAIADVPAFVTPDGAVDAEARRRGQTVYLPDGRVPLHPEVLSEDAASLLPDRERPAFVWTFLLDAAGAVVETGLERARIRSRAQLTYGQVQAFLDAQPGAQAPTTPRPGVTDADRAAAEGWPAEVRDSLALLPEVGRRRAAQEAARGGASLNLPDQEVRVTEDGAHELVHRAPLPAEEHNAQLSLLTGMAAAELMLAAGVGILRTMPAPDADAIAAFRERTHAPGALGQDRQGEAVAGAQGVPQVGPGRHRGDLEGLRLGGRQVLERVHRRVHDAVEHGGPQRRGEHAGAAQRGQRAGGDVALGADHHQLVGQAGALRERLGHVGGLRGRQGGAPGADAQGGHGLRPPRRGPRRPPRARPARARRRRQRTSSAASSRPASP